MSITRVTPSEAQLAVINELMAAPYPVTLETFAQRLEMSPLEAARHLPEGVVDFVSGEISERFEEVWASLCEWEKATLFIIHSGNVFEVSAKLSTGKIARGYYNIMHKDAVVGGHIAYESLSACGFVRTPFMGRESLAVIFFDRDGNVAFSAYAGRENHQIIESVKAQFEADAKRFAL